ncbi:FliK: predicted flagellar hook-length control protein [Desulfosarcina variabilis str. Montpellier]|uniref:flagellar hook-length control protein FliK n=1 Tax=Desulfosarcina variabilis TaxID=2300 RepID=UPI003AFAFBE4
MDIGAFMQSFCSGESIISKRSGMPDKANFNVYGQSSGELATDNETTSFIQAVQQILGQTDSGQGVSDELNGFSQSGQEPSNDLSPILFLLEMLGQKEIGELESMTNPENDSDADGTIADLLVQINAQLAGMDVTVQDLSGENTENLTRLMPLLHNNMLALETSITRSEMAISDDTLNDLQKTRALLQTAIRQTLHSAGQENAFEKVANDVTRPVPIPTDTPEMGISSNASTSENIAAKLANVVDRMTQMTDNHLADNRLANGGLTDGQMADNRLANGGLADGWGKDDVANSIASAMATKKMASQLVIEKASSRSNFLAETLSDSSVQAKTDITDGNNNRAKSLAQALMAQNENPQARQDANHSTFENDTDPRHPLEWVGHKKETGKGVPPVSTTTGQPQAASSQQVLDQRLFANDKQSLKDAPQPQAVDNEVSRVAVSNGLDRDVVKNESFNAALPADPIIDSKASTGGAGKSTTIPMPASGDTAFQKTVMNQIVEKATLRSVNDRSEMRIQLKPDSLGEVRMNIVSEKNQLVVQMIAEKSETKEIIESQIHHLKAELDKQGLTVGKIEVMISANNDSQDGRGQFFQMFKNNPDGSGKRQSGTRQETASQHQSDEKEADSSGDGVNYFA